MAAQCLHHSLFAVLLLVLTLLPCLEGARQQEELPVLRDGGVSFLSSSSAHGPQKQEPHHHYFWVEIREEEEEEREGEAIRKSQEDLMAGRQRRSPLRDDKKRGRWKKIREKKESRTTEATTTEAPEEEEEEEEAEVHVVSWRWDHMGVYVTITLFIVLSGLAKVAFHHAHFLSSWIPESCLLVIVGLSMGGIVQLLEVEDADENSVVYVFPKFTPDLFFYVLLPPIILEAAYSLYDKAFFDNLSTILVMAVIGTAFNFLAIGLLLYLVYYLGAMGQIRGPFPYDPEVDDYVFIGVYELSITEILVFASLISAVDPVAVLAIFQEVGVNPDLYFLLFGESLLNDGVAVVLYTMMNTFAEIQATGGVVGASEIALGIASFFTVALGGLSVGIIIGFLTALITKTTSEVRVVEPLALFGMAYLSYVTAELFHWSGIISLIGCGLVQAHYSFKNISKKSYTTVKYFIKMLSATSDCVIFLFLGIALMDGPHYWHTGFVVWTVSFTLICRFVGVYGLVFLANRRRIRKVNLQEQFIMAYGGLRGAVGFSLVEMIDKEVIPPKQMFVTTTLAVVMFTIFFQGGTIKFLVNLLDIDKAKDSQRLIAEEVHDTVTEHVMAGIEVISGKRGSQYFGRLLERYDEKYLMKWFCKQTRESDLTVLFEELAISDHLCNLYGPSVLMDPAVTKTELLQRALKEDVADGGSDDDDTVFRGSDGEGDGGGGGGDRDELLSRKSSFMRLPAHPPGPVSADVLQQHAATATAVPGPSSSAAQLSPTSISSGDRRSSLVVALMGAHNRDSLRLSRRPSNRSAVTNGDAGVTSDEDALAGGGGGLRRRKTTRREDRETLKNAVRNSPYSRFHYRYNPNLVGDEDQELETHLRKRHASARRLSSIALATTQLQQSHKNSVDSAYTVAGAPGAAGGAGPLSPTGDASAFSPTRKISSPVSPTSDNLLRIPPRNRPGVQAILDKQRMRSISVTSDPQMGHQHASVSDSEAYQQQHHHRHPNTPQHRFTRSQTTRVKKTSMDSALWSPQRRLQLQRGDPTAPALPPRGATAAAPASPLMSHSSLGRSVSVPPRRAVLGASTSTDATEDNLPCVVEMQEEGEVCPIDD